MYNTYPIVEQSEDINSNLQQNLSDIAYRVLFFNESKFVKAFNQGMDVENLRNFLLLELSDTIKDLENKKGYTYVVDSIKVDNMNVEDETLYLSMKATSGSMTAELSQDILKRTI